MTPCQLQGLNCAALFRTSSTIATPLPQAVRKLVAHNEITHSTDSPRLLPMVTGFEVAGLALGAFPLAVEFIKFYADGARTMQDMRHHRHILDEFVRELDMESCKFANTCDDLFEGVVSAEEVSNLRTRSEQDLWSDKAVQAKMTERLRPHSIKQFKKAVEALNATLNDLTKRFVVDETKVATL